MSTLKADTIVAADGSSPVTLTKQTTVKSYAKGSDAAVLAHSHNVSSGTDNGGGDYSYALTNAMSSADTAVVVTPYTNISRAGINNPNRDTASVMAGVILNPYSGAYSDMPHTMIQTGDLA